MTIRILKGLGWAALVLSVWAAILLVMPFVGPAGRQVAVVGDQGRAVRAIAAAGGSVVDLRRGAVLARSPDPHFPSRLYASGARLVLEGRIGAGCFSR
jgi:hypothetical protein